MTKRQAWIVVGAAAAVLVVGYLATMREINATITAGDATITYRSGMGAAGAPTAQDDSHARMLRLIEESGNAINVFDASTRDATVVR